MSQKRLQGQTVWISGGASGIGEVAAKLFAQQDANVAVADVQIDRGQAVVEQPVAQFGQLTSLVNSAGAVHVRLFRELSKHNWDTVMGVKSQILFLAAMANPMSQAEARIISLVQHAHNLEGGD